MAQSSIELRSLDADTPKKDDRQQDILNSSSEPLAPVTEFASLPPVDTGKEAWLFLAACWGVEAVTFGEFAQDIDLLLASLLTGFKVSDSLSVSSRTITALMNLSRAQAVSPLLVPPRR